MLQAADISRLTYELVRQLGDENQMKWEDDRSRLIEVTHRLVKSNHTQVFEVQEENRTLKEYLKQLRNIMVVILSGKGGKENRAGNTGTVASALSKQKSKHEYVQIRKRQRSSGSDLVLLMPEASTSTKENGNQEQPASKLQQPKQRQGQLSERWENANKNDQDMDEDFFNDADFSTSTMTRINNNGGNRGDSGLILGSSSIATTSLNTCNQANSTSASLQKLTDVLTRNITATTSSSSSASRNRSNNNSNNVNNVEERRVQKNIEVVRNKEKRAALPGYVCTECRNYYEALYQQGLVSDEALYEILRKCGRHKAQFTPEQTPEGYWDLSVNTPADWKK